MCILRNLSYRLELEVDALEAGEDILDREWEQEQRREAEFVPSTFSRRSPGCLAMCVKSHTKDDMPRKPTSSRQTVYNVDFVYPGMYMHVTGVYVFMLYHVVLYFHDL